jgi:hypothetical protein
MKRIKTPVLAGVLGFGGVVSLSAPAPAATSDTRRVLSPVQLRATHMMTYPSWPVTSFAPAVRGSTAPTASPSRIIRDWSTGRDLTLAKPWLTPSR